MLSEDTDMEDEAALVSSDDVKDTLDEEEIEAVALLFESISSPSSPFRMIAQSPLMPFTSVLLSRHSLIVASGRSFIVSVVILKLCCTNERGAKHNECYE